MPLAAERFEIIRALAHGHVAAVLGTVRRLGLDKALPKRPERRARLILAMIVARIIEPAAKLATARQLSEATAAHSLGSVLGLGEQRRQIGRVFRRHPWVRPRSSWRGVIRISVGACDTAFPLTDTVDEPRAPEGGR